MAYSHQKRDAGQRERRKKFGAWLKARRGGLEMTQLDMSNALGYQYYVTISQVERGVMRVPPEDWKKWANLLKIAPKDFAIRALAHYDPLVFDLLFSETEHARIVNGGK